MAAAKSAPPSLTAAETKALNAALETAEYFDSKEDVQAKAKAAADLLRAAAHACAFTGAGISTSAGIGDYRGKDGVWTDMDTGVQEEKEEVAYEGGARAACVQGLPHNHLSAQTPA